MKVNKTLMQRERRKRKLERIATMLDEVPASKWNRTLNINKGGNRFLYETQIKGCTYGLSDEFTSRFSFLRFLLIEPPSYSILRVMKDNEILDFFEEENKGILDRLYENIGHRVDFYEREKSGVSISYTERCLKKAIPLK